MSGWRAAVLAAVVKVPNAEQLLELKIGGGVQSEVLKGTWECCKTCCQTLTSSHEQTTSLTAIAAVGQIRSFQFDSQRSVKRSLLRANELINSYKAKRNISSRHLQDRSSTSFISTAVMCLYLLIFFCFLFVKKIHFLSMYKT